MCEVVEYALWVWNNIFLLATNVGTAELWLVYIRREPLPLATGVALSPEEKTLVWKNSLEH
jgi:hypothetical protein